MNDEIKWKRINEFLTNRKIPFTYYPEKEDYWYADFGVYDENGKLFLLIDSTGNEIFKIEDGMKVILYEDLDTEEIIEEIFKAFGLDYSTFVKEIMDSMPKDFPYPSYKISDMKKDFESLCNTPYKTGQKFGMKIVMHFHHSIWDASVRGSISPSTAWKDKTLLEKVIKNRIIYKPVLSPRNIAQGFTISKTAMKVSVFNPSFAKHLVDTYAADSNTIVDPFSGFSGRLLGAIASGKYYIGLDINPNTICEMVSLIQGLGVEDKVTLYEGDLLTVPNKGIGEDDAVCITCSPYNLKETWGMPIQDKSCDEWIEEVIKRIKAKRYIFVVDRTERYADKIVEKIDNTSHFGSNTELVVKIE